MLNVNFGDQDVVVISILTWVANDHRLIGLKLDQWLGTKGVFITVFIILGVIGGANVVYRQVMEIIRDKEKNQKGRQNGID